MEAKVLVLTTLQIVSCAKIDIRLTSSASTATARCNHDILSALLAVSNLAREESLPEHFQLAPRTFEAQTGHDTNVMRNRIFYVQAATPALHPLKMADQRLPPDERPYSEPEIIPPSQGDGNEPEYPVWGQGTIEQHGIHRIYVTKVGSFGLLPLALLGGVIAIALLAILFGFLLILIPVAGLILATAIIGSFLRGGPR